MASQNFFDVLIEIEGENAFLEAFFLQHLSKCVFTFNSIKQMAPELDFELNNFVEDGYNALYGDWQTLCGRRMFADAASQRGYPFPLETREQVIECIKALGEHGDRRIELGRIFKSNLDRFGHGHKSEWRRENWGIECDADDVIVAASPDSLGISFNLCATPPKKLLVLLTKLHPELGFTISHVSEAGKRSKKILMKNGKEIEKYAVEDEAIASAIWEFRRTYGIHWIGTISQRADCVEYLVMNQRGRAEFKGTGIAVDFAIRRLFKDEAFDALAQRLPELNPGQVQLLKLLFEGLKSPHVMSMAEAVAVT